MTAASMSLPSIIHRGNKYQMGALLYLITAILYLTSNHYHLFEPRMLPLSTLDQITPFMPNTVWIYVSEYFLFASVFIFSKDFLNLNKYFYSFLSLQIMSVFIFWVWPTTYPRDLFPLSPDLNTWTYALFSSLRQSDTPANCCPSLHVSSVYLSSFIFLDEQKEKFPFFFLWATAIAVSTMTTKQHYLVDIGAGFILAVLNYWIFHKWTGYRVNLGVQPIR